jgi:hypothetical protein
MSDSNWRDDLEPRSKNRLKSNLHNTLLFLRNDEGMRDCLECDEAGRIIIRKRPGDAEFFRIFGPGWGSYPRVLEDVDLTDITCYLQHKGYLQHRGMEIVGRGTVFKAINIMLKVAP